MTKKDQPRAAQQAPNKCMKGVKMECQGKGNDLNLTGPALVDLSKISEETCHTNLEGLYFGPTLIRIRMQWTSFAD